MKPKSRLIIFSCQFSDKKIKSTTYHQSDHFPYNSRKKKAQIKMSKEEIKKLLFDAKVPLRVTVPGVPIHLCFNAPRSCSLGTFLHLKLATFFPDDTKNLWFAHSSQAVKWWFPIGVLYDLYAPESEDQKYLDIDVNFDNFPDSSVPRCESKDIASYYFSHSFKESTFLTDQNLQLIQSQAEIHQKIEKCIEDNDYDNFQQLLALKIAAKDIKQWDRWPIRVINKEKVMVPGFLKVEEGQKVEDVLNSKSLECDKVIVQGINIDKGLSLEDVVPLLMSPDGFLYMVLK